jgi:hypothetical protein
MKSGIVTNGPMPIMLAMFNPVACQGPSPRSSSGSEEETSSVASDGFDGLMKILPPAKNISTINAACPALINK